MKVLITGPESTGKSTISKRLAADLGGCWVNEYARAYLHQLGRPYEAVDLLAIGQGQFAQEDAITAECSGPVVVDTGPLVLYVWSLYKYGRVHEWLARQWQERQYDLIFLCDIDWPWAEDPLREHPHQRQELMGIYLQLLDHYGRQWHLLHGELNSRLATAKQIIREYGVLKGGTHPEVSNVRGEN